MNRSIGLIKLSGTKGKIDPLP